MESSGLDSTMKPYQAFTRGFLQSSKYGILAIVLLVICLSVLSFMGVIGEPKCRPVTSTGFAKIKPELFPFMKSNGTFEATFLNGAGTDIYINEVRVFDRKTNQSRCSKFLGENVPGRENNSFRVSMDNCGSFEKGGCYDLKVEIDYNTTISGMNYPYSESGNLIGQVDLILIS